MGSQLKDALKAAGLAPASAKKGEIKDRSPKKSRIEPRASGKITEMPAHQMRQQQKRPDTHGRKSDEAGRLREQLIALHGAYSQGRKAERLAVKHPQQKAMCFPAVTREGSFSPHPLLAMNSVIGHARTIPGHDGIARQLASNPSAAADLVLGLDFGTSSVKAVIRDHAAGIAFAVPFSAGSPNPYLLPSRVWRSGDNYSLDAGTESLRDLKLSLLDCPAKSPIGEFNEACAFLALVVRHCRGWFFDTYGARYSKHELQWRINLGLPARSYEDEPKVELFRRLAWAAGNCASDESRQISTGLIDRYRKLSLEAMSDEKISGNLEFLPEDTDVIPEIAAQIFGFVMSERWNWRGKPMMMMVDVGAGTVDAAFFSILKNDKGLQFSFFADDVQPAGVMNLHRERVSWLREVFSESGIHDDALGQFLEGTARSTDRLGPVPDSVLDYVSGYRIGATPETTTADSDFLKKEYWPQVFRCIRGAREMGVPDTQLTRLPFFLCGGGSRMKLYSNVVEIINDTPMNVTVQPELIPKPDDLVAEGLPASDYDRLSVAYGLSREGAGGKPLGDYVRRLDIPPVTRPQAADYRDNYIEK